MMRDPRQRRVTASILLLLFLSMPMSALANSAAAAAAPAATPAAAPDSTAPAPTAPAAVVTPCNEARADLFGSLQIVEVHPAAARVLVDGETIAPPAGSGPRLVNCLPAGSHRVSIAAPGYRDLSEEIAVAAGATLERSYRLKKNRTWLWYASRGLAGAAVVGLAVVLLSGDDTTTSGPLPGPPDPPDD